jgi:ABC-type polysaccharide/polyol phosphate export permease
VMGFIELAPCVQHGTRPRMGVCTREQASCIARPIMQVKEKGVTMLTTLIVILLVMWLLGVATSYTVGGLIHILLVVAIIAVLLRVIQGRNPLAG